MNNYEETTEMGKDLMREIGSIGTGNASTALSALLNTKIEMIPPEVRILPLQEVATSLGFPEDEVMAILSKMSGNVNGIILVILHLNSIDTIIKTITEKNITKYSDLDEMDYSIITEVGNILISSYVNAMSAMTEFDIELSVPVSAIDMIGGIMNVPLAEVGFDVDSLMLVSGRCNIEDQYHDMNVIMVPNMESLDAIMKKLGIE